jgi:hypothetical protein
MFVMINKRLLYFECEVSPEGPCVDSEGGSSPICFFDWGIQTFIIVKSI